MDKIAIIGATGFVGKAITAEALSRGFEMTAIVRDISKLDPAANLHAVACDVKDPDRLTSILRGFRAVISAYNPGWKNPEIYDDTLAGYRSILLAAEEARVARLLIVGGAGSLYVGAGQMLMETGAIPDDILPGVQALARVYIEMLPKVRDIDWVFFSPAGKFVEGGRTGNYRLGRDNLILNVKGDSEISVEDYAKAMVDEADSPEHHRERFTIGYRDQDPTHPRVTGNPGPVLHGI
ncbi:MAG: NAD(P)H-binding protein [Alistipes sp.]|nr:NAD(P)H-binding protein [Alistipes sp.]